MTKPMQGIDGKEFENAIFIGLIFTSKFKKMTEAAKKMNLFKFSCLV